MIERAKSSRSKCKSCKGKIEKDELRFGVLDFSFSESGSYHWYHLRCAGREQSWALTKYLDSNPALPEPRESIEKLALGAPDEAVAHEEDVDTPAWLAPFVEGKEPKFSKWLNASVLPPLVDPEGHRLPVAGSVAFTRALKDADADTIGAFRAHVTPPSISSLVWEVFSQWQRNGGTLRETWMFDALEAYGDDKAMAEFADVIAGWIRDSNRERTEQGLRVLAESDRKSAHLALLDLAHRFQYKGHHNHPQHWFRHLAKRKRLSTDHLEDELVPRCGLNERGVREWSLGPRTIRLDFDDEFSPIFREMETGKVYKRFPSARSSDDDVLVRRAQDEYDAMKSLLVETLKVQRRRLERALVMGRRWSVARWRSHILEHPVMISIARRVVWAEYDASGELVATFRVDEDDLLLDVEDDAVELASGAEIGLVHPAELSPDLRAAWNRLFVDYEIFAAFDQIGRPVTTCSTPAASEIPSPVGEQSIEPGPLHGLFNRVFWEKGEGDYSAEIRDFHKVFPRWRITAWATLSPGLRPWGNDGPQTIDAIFFTPSGGSFADDKPRLKLGDVPAVAFSEVMYDVARFRT